MSHSFIERREAGDLNRLLYFDPQPEACIRAMDAAADLRIAIQTVSHPMALPDICRIFRPTASLVVLRPGEAELRAVLQEFSAANMHVPILVAGDHDISRDQELDLVANTLDLDLRGSVRLGSDVRDLQLCLLSAISRLAGDALGRR